jgi:hypothetical protein
MSDLPFFVYKSKYEEIEKLKETVERKQIRQLSFEKDILNKIELFNMSNLFAGETTAWVRNHTSEIGSLNVFMIALTYLLMSNISLSNAENDQTRDIYNIDELMNEFTKHTYNNYRKYLIDDKEVDKVVFNRNIRIQVDVYSRKIKAIMTDENS